MINSAILPPTALETVHPDHLRVFGETVQKLLGLSQPLRNEQTLARRFIAAMEASGHASEPEAFVRGLSQARPGSAIYEAIANVVPNRETTFFRDVEQLQSFIRGPLKRTKTEHTVLRILSAGCATGEEVYTLAMLLLEDSHLFWGRPFHIHGIDISAESIETARKGLYRPSTLARSGEGPEGWRERYFRKEKDDYRIKSIVRSSTTFQQANLLGDESLQQLGGFDAVICRNVLIYFDSDTLQETVSRLISLSRPGGVLLLGHAESGLVERHEHLRLWEDDRVCFARPEDE